MLHGSEGEAIAKGDLIPYDFPILSVFAEVPRGPPIVHLIPYSAGDPFDIPGKYLIVKHLSATLPGKIIAITPDQCHLLASLPVSLDAVLVYRVGLTIRPPAKNHIVN